jgi:hypothetical protein
MSRKHEIGLALIVAMAAAACDNPRSAQPTASAPAGANASATTTAQASPVTAGAPAQPAISATPAAATAAPAVTAAASAMPAKEHVFRTEPVKPGYLRFEPPALEVPPGGSENWAQFVGGPLDQDYDVEDVNGVQSEGGHHALVYATSMGEPPGTTRLWKDEDQLAARLMGGIGGEGGANVSLPAGIVFRIRKGSYILIQTHYLNASDKTIVGRSVIDVKLAPMDKTRRVASMMSNTSLAINLPAHAQTGMDVYCDVQKDLQFLMISNHMHDWGTATVTDYVDPQGVMHVFKNDVTWSGDYALNPEWTKFPVETPGLITKGSRMHTHCTWNNNTDAPIKFPTEMCVFFGFVLNENDIYCTDNKWSEASNPNSSAAESSSSTPTTTAGAAAPTPAVTSSAGGASGALAGAGGASGAAGGAASTAPAFGCTGDKDKALMDASDFSSKTESCALSCFSDPDVASCSKPCFERTIGLSPACATCNSSNLACSMKTCFSECLTDSASAPCRDCVKAKCDPAFRQCTGT